MSLSPSPPPPSPASSGLLQSSTLRSLLFTVCWHQWSSLIFFLVLWSIFWWHAKAGSHNTLELSMQWELHNIVYSTPILTSPVGITLLLFCVYLLRSSCVYLLGSYCVYLFGSYCVCLLGSSCVCLLELLCCCFCVPVGSDHFACCTSCPWWLIDIHCWPWPCIHLQTLSTVGSPSVSRRMSACPNRVGFMWLCLYVCM